MFLSLHTNNDSPLKECRRIINDAQRLIETQERAMSALEERFFSKTPVLCDDTLRDVFLHCECRDIFHGLLVCTRWNTFLKDPMFLRDFFSVKAPNAFQVGKDLPIESWGFYGRAQLLLATINANSEKIEAERTSIWSFAKAVIQQLTPW